MKMKLALALAIALLSGVAFAQPGGNPAQAVYIPDCDSPLPVLCPSTNYVCWLATDVISRCQSNLWTSHAAGTGGTECVTSSCDLNTSTTLNTQGICLADGTNCPASTDDQTAAEVAFTPDDGTEWTDTDPTEVDAALENLAPRVILNDAKVTADATNVNAAGAVMESDYDAHTILQATTDDIPVAITVAEERLVGRITGGNITALTKAQALTLLNVVDDADVDTVQWFNLRWTFDQTADCDLGSGDAAAGEFCFNHATPTSATVLYLADVAHGGVDSTLFLSNLEDDNVILLQDVADSTKTTLVQLSLDSSDGTGEWVLTFDSIAQSTDFVDGDIVGIGLASLVDGGAGTGAFSDAADPVLLNTTGKRVIVGPASPENQGKLSVHGDADEAQLVVEGFSTQTTYVVLAEAYDGTDYFSVGGAGKVSVPLELRIPSLASPTTNAIGEIAIDSDGTLNEIHSFLQFQPAIAATDYYVIPIDTLPVAADNGKVQQYDSGTDKMVWATPAGGGDVTAAAVIAATAVVVGDDGAKGVQDSGVLIDASDNVTGVLSLTVDPSATPTVAFDDSGDTGADDMTIVGDCPTAGDCDLAFKTEAGGVLTEAFRIDTDSDGAQEVYLAPSQAGRTNAVFHEALKMEYTHDPVNETGSGTTQRMISLYNMNNGITIADAAGGNANFDVFVRVENLETDVAERVDTGFMVQSTDSDTDDAGLGVGECDHENADPLASNCTLIRAFDANDEDIYNVLRWHDTQEYATSEGRFDHTDLQILDEIAEVTDTAVDADAAATDEMCLTFENASGSGTRTFAWQTCGGGSGDITDVMNCASGDCADIAAADGDSLDFSGVTLSSTGEGLILNGLADCDAITGVTANVMCYDTTDDALCVYDGTAMDCQTLGASGSDIISEGDSSVEVIDAASGQVDIDVDGGNVGSWTVSGLAIGGTDVTDQLTLPTSVDAATPTLAFGGDPDTGLYNGAANTVTIAVGGQGRHSFSQSSVKSSNGGGYYLKQQGGTSSLFLYTTAADLDTGINLPGSDVGHLGAGDDIVLKWRDNISGTDGNGATYLEIIPGQTGVGPTIGAIGETNTDLILAPAGTGTLTLEDSTFRIEEVSADEADTAGYGQVWAKNNTRTTYSELVFTSDDGTQHPISTQTKSMYWPAAGMSTDGTNCSAPVETDLGTGGVQPKQYTINCPLTADGEIFGQAVTLPDGFVGGSGSDLVFELSAIIADDPGATETLHAVIYAQCISNDTVDALSTTWTNHSDIALDFVLADEAWAVAQGEAAVLDPDGTCAGGDTLHWYMEVCQAVAGNCVTASDHDTTNTYILGMKMEYLWDADDS